MGLKTGRFVESIQMSHLTLHVHPHILHSQALTLSFPQQKTQDSVFQKQDLGDRYMGFLNFVVFWQVKFISKYKAKITFMVPSDF